MVSEQKQYEKHPRGKRELGTCDFLECTEDAVRAVRVSRGSGLALRVMIHTCEQHAQMLDSGATVLLEFHKA